MVAVDDQSVAERCRGAIGLGRSPVAARAVLDAKESCHWVGACERLSSDA